MTLRGQEGGSENIVLAVVQVALNVQILIINSII